MEEKLTLFDAFSYPPDPLQGNEPRPQIYRTPQKPETGFFPFVSPFYGKIRNNNGDLIETNEFEIAYTVFGDRGPLVITLHGVPTNRKRHYPLARRLAPFCRVVCLDMLGMGESSHPLEYGFRVDQKLLDQHNLKTKGYPWDWSWVNDTVYIHEMFKTLFPDDEKFAFVADDWGGGINSHYAARYPNELAAFIQIDPIAGQGYPVSEIQAIGRMALLGKEVKKALSTTSLEGKTQDVFVQLFQQLAVGALDQTMVQIFKTMVYNPDKVYNQWSLRTLKETYVDTDYERTVYRNGEQANSLTLRLRMDAIQVLADRAAILAPELLLPYESKKNPEGVQFDKITAPSLIIFGNEDSMMSAGQIYDYMYQLSNSQTFRSALIKNVGHFAIDDDPNRVAEEILNFLVGTYGVKYLADVFLGYSGIWKGEEEQRIAALRKLLGYTN